MIFETIYIPTVPNRQFQKTQGFPGNIGLEIQKILSKTKLWAKERIKTSL